MIPVRIGYGYDVHRLQSGGVLKLGGIVVSRDVSPVAHSDGDVLLHAIADALLGAAALGDIGMHFPDDDERYRGIDSGELLVRVVEMLKEAGYRPGNVDATVVLEKPKLRPFINTMRERVAAILAVEPSFVSIKATTSEKMGFVGSGEGIAAHAVALITVDNAGA
ncbi:MAG: 2-C-methyl-D-erythritol 2,4-cyclodiphosphate synthase [Chlorobi bacterium]|nr:2-C-methyl-D-erythritol 2,4-cyclodiphosphate synthase [Chlorobiota bacterium]